MLSIRALILRAGWATLGFACAAGVAAAAATGARARPVGPRCQPARLNNSALLAGAVSVSPLPGSRDANPRTQISFLGVRAREIAGVRVVGSLSGRHGGRLLPYSQGDGASFLPGRSFREGERVSVTARLRRGRRSAVLRDTFAVAHEDAISSTPEASHPGTAAQVQGFRSRPDLRPPAVAVTASSPAAAPGEEFVAPYSGPGQAGPMILDASGALVWFKRLAPGVSASDFRVQRYAGAPVLTWWQGDITVHGFGIGGDVIADSSYRTVARVQAGNGLAADLHEFLLTPRASALITAYEPVLCDLSGVGGPAYGAVTDGVLQEIDVRTGLVRREWTSLDHVALGDSYEHAASSLASPYDFFHINSIGLQAGGGLLVSSRNTWTVYGVQARSGQVRWRLGGKRSSFRLAAGAGTAWQHDPRELPDGTLSIFDNGSSPTVHPQSRGIVVRLDQRGRTATVVTQLTHAPGLIAESQGNLQSLENGDWFVGWGQFPDFSELGPDGRLLFDAHLPPHSQSYRAFRFAWNGRPTHRPAFVLQSAPGAAGTVYASWNGATGVAAWRVLAGPTPASMSAVAQTPRGGFETAIALPPGSRGPDLAVQALDGAGAPLGTSATVAEAMPAPAG